MTRERDFIGQLEAYLDEFEGMTPLPDAARDAIRAQLPSIQQRPAWWPARRIPEMSTTTKFALGAAAAAAVVAIALVSLQFVGSPNVGGPNDTAPSASAALPASGESLPAGTYYIDVQLYAYSTDGQRSQAPVQRLTFDLPAGYSGAGFAVQKHDEGATGMLPASPNSVFNAPCDSGAGSATLNELPAMREPSGFTETLADLWQGGANPVTSEPTEATVAGRDAMYVELTAPDDIDFADCFAGQYRLWNDVEGGVRYLQEPGQLDRVWVLDMEPGLLVIDAALSPGASATDRAEIDAIIGSLRIEPAP